MSDDWTDFSFHLNLFFSNLFPSSFDCAALWHIAMSVAKHFKKMTTSKVNQSVDFLRNWKWTERSRATDDERRIFWRSIGKPMVGVGCMLIRVCVAGNHVCSRQCLPIRKRVVVSIPISWIFFNQQGVSFVFLSLILIQLFRFPASNHNSRHLFTQNNFLLKFKTENDKS